MFVVESGLLILIGTRWLLIRLDRIHVCVLIVLLLARSIIKQPPIANGTTPLGSGTMLIELVSHLTGL